MALFDAETFLDEDVGGTLSTERTLVPIGTYESCYIKGVKPQEGIIGKGDRTGEPWARMVFQWVIDDDAVRTELGKTEVVVSQGIMLDLDASGKLDTSKGKNIRLGKLRAALGINDGDVKWREFLNKPATLQIGHEVYKDSPIEAVTAVVGH